MMRRMAQLIHRSLRAGLQRLVGMAALRQQLAELQVRHEEIVKRHEEIAARHDEIKVRHNEIVRRHEEMVQSQDQLGEEITARHEEIVRRHEDIAQRHDELGSAEAALLGRLRAAQADLSARLSQLAERQRESAAALPGSPEAGQRAGSTPRLPTGALIADIVEHCSHGSVDPETQIGCQRESPHDLGFGWIYFALARACEARRALVIGSGRGFAPACFALGMEHRPGAEIVLVDPGYGSWTVDGVVQDTAAGFWRTPEQITQHFADNLNIHNVRWLAKRSDDAFEELRARGDRFDLILIDGDHSYQQCLSDLRQALSCLQPGGLVLVHDAFCPHWPGVAFAIDTLALEEPALQRLCVPLFPGLALLQKSHSLITIRRLTAAENEQVNTWRVAQGVHPRPLPDGDDPRPGEETDDPRVGLFGIYEDGQLIGGVGLRRRVFQGTGADDFVPDAGPRLEGLLCYGLVICPEKQGQGYMQSVRQQLLSWCREEGYYGLSRHMSWGSQDVRSVTRVGAAGEFTAYHFRLRQDGDSASPAVPMPLASRLQAQVQRLHLQPLQAKLQDISRRRQEEVSQLRQQADKMRNQLRDLSRQRQEEVGQLRQQAEQRQEELREVSQLLEELLHSTSWRWTYPGRLLGRRLRSFWSRFRRGGGGDVRRQAA